MTDRPQDVDLRARFDAQRRADASQLPSFAGMLERARDEAAVAAPAVAAHPRKRRGLVYAGGLAAAVIAALLLVPRSRLSEDAFEEAVRAFQNDPALGGWRSPTDGLLAVPGSRLISTVPSVGAAQ